MTEGIKLAKLKPVYVIIGAGHAGISAAENLRKLDSKIPITIIDNDPDSFYYKAALKFFVKNHINENQLAGRSQNYLKNLKISFIRKKAQKIDIENKTVVFEDEKIQPYIKLLLATGGTPFIPPIPGKELKSVYPLRTLQDARKIGEIADSGKHQKCCILGAGLLGTELGEALRIRGIQVELFTQDDIVIQRMIDESCSSIIVKLFEKQGVKIHFKTSFNKILDDGTGHVSGIESSKGDLVECDGVFICTGIRRNIRIAQDAGLKTNRGIIVDQYLKTDSPDIFAAGDVVEYFDEATNSHKLIELWGPAGVMGKIAASNMLGGTLKYNIGAFHAYTLLWGHTIHVLGNFKPQNPSDFDIKTFMQQKPGKMNYFKLIFQDNYIKGSMSVGEARDPTLIQRIIKNKIPIPENITKDEVMQRDFDYDRIIYGSKK